MPHMRKLLRSLCCLSGARTSPTALTKHRTLSFPSQRWTLRLKAMSHPAQGDADRLAQVSCLLACLLDLTVTTVYARGMGSYCLCPPPRPSLSFCLTVLLFLFPPSVASVSWFSLFSPHLSPSVITPALSGSFLLPLTCLRSPFSCTCPPHALPSLCSDGSPSPR